MVKHKWKHESVNGIFLYQWPLVLNQEFDHSVIQQINIFCLSQRFNKHVSIFMVETMKEWQVNALNFDININLISLEKFTLKVVLVFPKRCNA